MSNNVARSGGCSNRSPTRGSSPFVRLRVIGAVHKLVLSGAAPALAAHFPSVGGDGDAAAAWPLVVVDRRRALGVLRRGARSSGADQRSDPFGGARRRVAVAGSSCAVAVGVTRSRLQRRAQLARRSLLVRTGRARVGRCGVGCAFRGLLPRRCATIRRAVAHRRSPGLRSLSDRRDHRRWCDDVARFRMARARRTVHAVARGASRSAATCRS